MTRVSAPGSAPPTPLPEAGRGPTADGREGRAALASLPTSGSTPLAPLPAAGRGWGRADAALWLQTGIYWLDTLERHTVSGPGPNTGDHILIGEIRSPGDQ